MGQDEVIVVINVNDMRNDATRALSPTKCELLNKGKNAEVNQLGNI